MKMKVWLSINVFFSIIIFMAGASYANAVTQDVTVLIEADVSLSDSSVPRIGECELIGWSPVK